MSNDIWSGASIPKSEEHKDFHFHYDPNIARMVASYNSDDGLMDILKVAGLILVIALGIFFSVVGPSMVHNSLVVCNGSSCTTYKDWKVISEDSKTGILEVWAGGRLQRLSNGTWHYE